ncbi:hypothetical protein MASR2M74_26230 [Paracoccaceae bacterium]
MLDVAAMKDLLSKMATPAVNCEAVAYLKAHLGLSERRACEIAGADRNTIRYQSRRPPDTALPGRLWDLANERRTFVYRRLFVLLRREVEASWINHIYRLYFEEGLTVRKRKARRKAIGTRAPILIEAGPRPAGRWISSMTSWPAGGAFACRTWSMRSRGNVLLQFATHSSRASASPVD